MSTSEFLNKEQHAAHRDAARSATARAPILRRRQRTLHKGFRIPCLNRPEPLARALPGRPGVFRHGAIRACTAAEFISFVNTQLQNWSVRRWLMHYASPKRAGTGSAARA